MGCGFAVLAAARSAAAGADAAEVAETRPADRARDARPSSSSTPSSTCAGAGGSAPRPPSSGSALAVKPVLHVQDGRVVPLEKVRTAARALNRLVQRAVETAGDGPVSVAVHHLAAPSGPNGWPTELRERLPALRELHVSELGAAIGAHVGPGSVGRRHRAVLGGPGPEDGERRGRDAAD